MMSITDDKYITFNVNINYLKLQNNEKVLIDGVMRNTHVRFLRS